MTQPTLASLNDTVDEAYAKLPDTPAESRLIEIKKQQREVDAAFAHLANCKEQVKAAKEHWEDAVDALGCIIRSAPVLPFNEGDDDD